VEGIPMNSNSQWSSGEKESELRGLSLVKALHLSFSSQKASTFKVFVNSINSFSTIGIKPFLPTDSLGNSETHAK
jgi:hypothetical protein